MQSILEKLYDEYGAKKTYPEEERRIDRNAEELKKSLNKNEKKLLLRIRDDAGLMMEKTSVDSFIDGAGVGAKLILEILYHDPKPIC